MIKKQKRLRPRTTVQSAVLVLFQMLSFISLVAAVSYVQTVFGTPYAVAAAFIGVIVFVYLSVELFEEDIIEKL